MNILVINYEFPSIGGSARVPGSEVLVHEGENGFLLLAKNSGALSEALLKLINNRQIAAQSVTACSQELLKHV